MSTANNATESLTTPLEMFYQRESQQGSTVAFVQPYPNGNVEKITWHEAGAQNSKNGVLSGGAGP